MSIIENTRNEVTCNKCHRTWSFNLEEFAKILNSGSVKCICGAEFSIEEGWQNTLISNNPFTRWSFCSDTMESNTVIVKPGHAVSINFEAKFISPPKLFCSPEKYPLPCEAHEISSSGFILLNSIVEVKGTPLPTEVKINWLAYGNTKKEDCLWRDILSQARLLELKGYYCQSLIESITALEVGIVDFLEKYTKRTGFLISKNKEDDLDATVKRLGISYLVRVLIPLITENHKELKPNVSEQVKHFITKRNKIIHKREHNATQQDAINAVASIFLYLVYLSDY